MNLDILANLLAIATVGISIYLFFADDLRKWSFLGYRSTALIILVDPKTRKFLLVKNNHKTNWYFPQGTIYSSDLNSLVSQTLLREIGLSELDFKFIKTTFLGVLRKDPSRKYAEKYRPGAISLLPFHGKAYLGCLVFLNSNKMKKLHLGYGISKAQMVSASVAFSLIDPRKKDLINRSQILKGVM